MTARDPWEAALAEVAELLDSGSATPGDVRVVAWRQWAVSGVAVATSDTACWVTFYGRAVPCTRFERNDADGSIHWDGPGFIELYGERRALPEVPLSQRPPGWASPLELPGCEQDLAKFDRVNQARRNRWRRWRLEDALQDALTEWLYDRYILFSDLGLSALKLSAKDLATLRQQWIAGVRRFLDPRIMRRARYLAGSRAANLQDYNLSAISGAMLTDLAQSNPGAVGWWLGARREDFGPHSYIAVQPAPAADAARRRLNANPTHPGEVVSRGAFRVHGRRRARLEANDCPAAGTRQGVAPALRRRPRRRRSQSGQRTGRRPPAVPPRSSGRRADGQGV